MTQVFLGACLNSLEGRGTESHQNEHHFQSLESLRIAGFILFQDINSYQNWEAPSILHDSPQFFNHFGWTQTEFHLFWEASLIS